MTTPIYLTGLVAAYAVGLGIPALFPVGATTEKLPEASRVDRAKATRFDDSTALQPEVNQLHEEATIEVSNEERRVLNLSAEVVNAILSGTRLEDQLLRMGLSNEQVETVKAIQEDAAIALKEIEKRNAKIVSDESGEYVSIAAFPEERSDWLSQIESDLHGFVGDDRSAVITRMIAFKGSHREVGIQRREVAITERTSGKYDLLIEERRFDSDGKPSFNTYYVVDPEKPERWGHLLNLTGKTQE